MKYVPLRSLIDSLPGGSVSPQGGDGILDRLGIASFEIEELPGLNRVSLGLAFADELGFEIPGVDGLGLYFGSNGSANQLAVEADIVDDLSSFEIRLVNAGVLLRFPTGMFRTVQWTGSEFELVTDAQGQPQPYEIGLGGLTVALDSDGDLTLSSGSAPPTVALAPLMIGETGIVVEADAVEFYLSGKVPAPNQAPGWRGIHIQTAKLYLPGALADSVGVLQVTDAYIGNGGFTGAVSTMWPNGLDVDLFGTKLTLNSVSLSLVQNSLVGSSISATMQLPFFEKALDVEIAIGADGGLTVGLGAGSGGLASLTVGGVLKLELDSLKFTVDDGLLTVRLSGMIIPTLQALKVPPIRVDNLEINSKGEVNLPGGWLELPKQYGLDFYSFKISITKFGIGREPDGRKWIGFSGGIKLVDGLPAGVSVDGLRIMCDENWSNPTFTLQGVGVELEIKDVLYFKGAVAFRNKPGDRRFDGSIKLELKSLKFKIDGEFVVGNTVSYRYMALYVGVDLPVGLPILSTGLSVFGMEGLFARRMAPNKLPDEKWYGIGQGEGWYKKPPLGIVSLADKWDPEPSSIAIGFGMTFGTGSDNGHTLSARALFVGVFPGPILMIQGAANLLKDRAKLGEDPLFRTLAVYDGKAGSLLVGLDIAYKYDEAAGKLVKLSAGTEAYYEFANPMAWRINLGLKTPREQRIQARIFNMFDANAYLMLNARQVAMGCWVGYDKEWKFGPLKVALSAWMESNVVVSFKPIQFYGDMALHGGVELSAFGFGFSLTVDARVEAEAFHPKHLLAELDVTLNLPAPLPKKKRRLTAHCRIEFGPTPDAPPVPVALKSVSIEHMKVSTTWPLPAGKELLKPVYDDGRGFLTSGTGDPEKPPQGIPVVPMDCRPTIHFSRSVHDDAKVGAPIQIPEPECEWIGDPDKRQGSARVRYALIAVVLDKWTGSAWTAVAGKGEGVSGLPELFGTWTPAAAASGPGIAQNRLTLWSKCGFTSFRHTGSDYADWFAGHFGGPDGYPCIAAPGPTPICLNFDGLEDGPLALPFAHPDHPGVIFDCPQPGGLKIDTHVDFRGFEMRTLCATGEGGIDISFAAPADHVRLRMPELIADRPPEVTGEAENGTPLEPVRVELMYMGPAGAGPGTLRIRPDRVTRIHVESTGFGTCLLEICATLEPSPAQLAAAAQASSWNQDAIGLWSGAGTVLEPHTLYRLRIATQIHVSEFHYGDGFNGARNLVQSAFFRTEGPPGLVTLSQPLEPAGASTETGLENLGLYVAQTIPPTVPARGEPPLLPRPVYRAYDVGVAFNEDYVDLMYRMAGRDLALILYDRNNQPVRGRNGAVAVAQNPWGVTETAGLTEMETSWLAMIAANQCVPNIDESKIPRNLTLTAPAETLAADMLYQARLAPLLLHEDFARIASGTGRWHPHDFTSTGGASAWSVGHTTAPVAANLTQTGMTGGGQSAVATLGTAAVLAADPRAPAEDPALWTDYRLAAGLRADTGAAIGLAFRWLGPQDFHLFAMDQRTGGGRTLYRVKAGVLTALAQDPQLFSHQTNYDVVIEAVGKAIKVWIDGAPLFDVIDPDAIPGGSVALHCSGSPAAIFSDVRVHDLSKAAKSVYGFSFTTSRFVNFVHHLHSHDDDAWPGRCTLPAPDFATAASEAVASLAAPLADEEARAFEALAEDLLGPRARQEPVRTETYRVSSAAGDALGLLVRSPEPFDPKRLSLELLHVAEDAPASIAPAAVKLIGATLGAAAPADENVTLLVRQAADLTGWRLQLRDPAIGAAAPLKDPTAQWDTIFEFGAEERMADATLVRIHSGNAAAGPAGSGRRLERFRAAASNPGDVKLAGDRVDLRLVDREGRVEHARRFFRDGLYAPIPVSFLRKADGTALMLLPTGSSTPGLPAGALRLGFAYRRDNRAAAPGSIVLAEGGDRSPEAAALDIPTQPPA